MDGYVTLTVWLPDSFVFDFVLTALALVIQFKIGRSLFVRWLKNAGT